MKTTWAVLLVFLIWGLFGLWFYDFLGAHTLRDAPPRSPHTESDLGSEDPENLKALADQRVVSEGQNDTETSRIKQTESSIVSRNTVSQKESSDDLNSPPAPFSNVVQIFRDSLALEFTVDFEVVQQQLLNYLNENPSSDLSIIGLYDAKERIMEPNLGRRRSVLLKNKLTQAGLPAERLWCSSDIREMFDQDQVSYLGGVLLMRKPGSESFRTTTAEGIAQNGTAALIEADSFSSIPIQQETSEIETKTETKPATVAKPKSIRSKERRIIFYPTIEGQSIVLRQNILDLLPVLSQWLDQDPKHRIKIVGHTDNVGHYEDNLVVGMRWANQMREWLGTTQKLNIDRLYTGSEGEGTPLYDNQTANGRFKNRRIELIFKP
jgi:outer membrane protein OmpA-like peptidoglycan-associated protein